MRGFIFVFHFAALAAAANHHLPRKTGDYCNADEVQFPLNVSLLESKHILGYWNVSINRQLCRNILLEQPLSSRYFSCSSFLFPLISVLTNPRYCRRPMLRSQEMFHALRFIPLPPHKPRLLRRYLRQKPLSWPSQYPVLCKSLQYAQALML